MEKRIEKERHGRPVEEITKLRLDSCQSTEISGLTDEYVNLTSLSLINVGLASLKGFPNLPKLKKLNLIDNQISGDLNLLHGCPNLSVLNLSGNKIKDIETLQPLKTLQELHSLDLDNCEVTSTEGYREKVFELLEGLKYLDGYDKNNEEADDDDESDGEEGHNGDHLVDLDDDSEDDEDEDDDVGLDYLEKPGLEDESEDEEFAPRPRDHEADDLDDEGDDSDEEPSRGVKRKHEDDEEDKEAI